MFWQWPKEPAAPVSMEEFRRTIAENERAERRFCAAVHDATADRFSDVLRAFADDDQRPDRRR